LLAIIGGTGKQGTALVRRFARAGVRVVVGSREASKGEKAAREMNALLGVTHVSGASNREAARAGDIVLLALPYEGMRPILEDIRAAAQGKIVINIASALDAERKSRAKIPPEGSITAEVQNYFGQGTRVVAALQNVSPETLEGDAKIDSDVLVCGGDKEAREQVIALIRRIGIDAFDAGVLANAVVVETLTAVLIAVNIKYKVRGAGIRLTKVPRTSDG
jgi:NADPH-dependent F420 reductase